MIMPWDKKDYPDAMKNLPKEVRDKAIEIANALLEERHMEEGIAIATAISRAKDWAANHGKETETADSGAHTTDVKHHGTDEYVIPDEDGWAIKKEGNKSKEHFDTKKEAVKEARDKARDDNASLTIQRKNGTIQSRTSYNPNKKGPKQD